MYCQYYSETLYTELSNYARPNLNWDNYYAGRLYDLQIMINYNTDPATAAAAAAMDPTTTSCCCTNSEKYTCTAC
jgi:hypothetical protein